MKFKLANRFRIEVRRDGELREVSEGYNLVTNFGLNLLIGGSVAPFGDPYAYVMLGSGTTPPAYTDTALDNPIQSLSHVEDGGYVRNTTDRLASFDATYSQSGSGFNGTIAEIGVYTTNSQLMTRALVEPAIAVTEADQITVVYTFAIQHAADSEGAFLLQGDSVDYETMPYDRSDSANIAYAIWHDLALREPGNPLGCVLGGNAAWGTSNPAYDWPLDAVMLSPTQGTAGAASVGTISVAGGVAQRPTQLLWTSVSARNWKWCRCNYGLTNLGFLYHFPDGMTQPSGKLLRLTFNLILTG